jgi:hypothetical protein
MNGRLRKTGVGRGVLEQFLGYCSNNGTCPGWDMLKGVGNVAVAVARGLICCAVVKTKIHCEGKLPVNFDGGGTRGARKS